MKRSSQEIVELVVFGLIALLVGTGLLWILGKVFAVAAVLFVFIANIVWVLLRFLLPLALVAGFVYFAINSLMQHDKKAASEVIKDDSKTIDVQLEESSKQE